MALSGFYRWAECDEIKDDFKENRNNRSTWIDFIQLLVSALYSGTTNFAESKQNQCPMSPDWNSKQ